MSDIETKTIKSLVRLTGKYSGRDIGSNTYLKDLQEINLTLTLVLEQMESTPSIETIKEILEDLYDEACDDMKYTNRHHTDVWRPKKECKDEAIQLAIERYENEL